MELVDYKDNFDSVSQSSYARGMQASEHARRRLRSQVGQRARQAEVVKAQVMRKTREIEAARRAVSNLAERRVEDERKVQRLKERKLVYRMFRTLDINRVESISQSDVFAALDGLTAADKQFIEGSLFQGLPTMYVVALRTHDFVPSHAQALLAEAIGASPEAVQVAVPDGRLSGSVVAEVTLLWHRAPETLTDAAADESEVRLLLESYFGPLGGDHTGVSMQQGRLKEEQLCRALTEVLPDQCECELVAPPDPQQRAFFSDFHRGFWAAAKDDPMLPAALDALYKSARQKEEACILPEEAGDKIRELEQAIAHERKQTEQLRKKSADAQYQIKTVDKEIAATVKELQHIQKETGYERFKSKPPSADYELQEAEAKELRALISRVGEEKTKGEQILRKKTQLIAELSKALDSLKEEEEVVYQLQNQVRVADLDIDRLTTELELLREDHRKSDRQIATLEGTRDVSAIESLEMDKEYLREQIEQHAREVQEQTQKVDIQSRRVESLEHRLRCVELAVRDLGMWPRVRARLKDCVLPLGEYVDSLQPDDPESLAMKEETVDVELYELLNRELEAVTESCELKDVLLLEKEATIMTVSDKVESLASAREEDEMYYEDELVRYKYETTSLLERLGAQRTEHRRQEQLMRRQQMAACSGKLREAREELAHIRSG
eukprot:TRINITY_DN20695_c0_g1_i1.p1 TRINITY_DN20695_c0_g1~~TRINITY_DN20695_c0_g1_i1.p1  ORF type:complete len:669 (+),score=174.72 TRINITY_DN20695_c0_g1_i1:73-2079(+)